MDPTIEVADGAARAIQVDGRWILQTDGPHLTELVAAVAEHRDQVVPRWVVSDPTGVDKEAAAEAGLAPVRDVLQLRRPLPVEPEIAALYPPVPVRAFRPGTADEQAWLACNNRAFAPHPDQARFTLERLHRLMAEPWFDPQGFLLHEEGGMLAGFCWTKVHGDAEPALAEIFVIGVDPAFAGRGLGGSITLTGLGSLADRELKIGMLYVDADNTSARRMYGRLGFALHHTDRIFEPAR